MDQQPSDYNEYHRLRDFYRAQENQKRRFPNIFSKLSGKNPRINLYLFLATCATTFLTGYLGRSSWQDGLWFSGGIISILLAHEMGHYLMCRKYGIKATLPYFIPFPPILNPFGTLGAVIKMQSAIPSRKALFDVAAAGPLAGLVFALPAVFFGVKLSEVVNATAVDSAGVIHLGESLLYTFLSDWAIGPVADSKDVMLHPLAFAGWAGLFVTALNLLPIGQLDGGHIIYALFGKRHQFIAIAALAGFAAIAIFVYHGWALFLFLLIWFGPKHPPTMDERPIDLKRKVMGVITIIIFFLAFTPKPLQF